MRLKLEVVSLQDKYGFELVSEGLADVRQEMYAGCQHDILGCWDCWQDPVTRKYSYCPQSVYNPFHFTHHCPYDQECACNVDPFLLV
jgi:hypothetical protein